MTPDPAARCVAVEDTNPVLAPPLENTAPTGVAGGGPGHRAPGVLHPGLFFQAQPVPGQPVQPSHRSLRRDFRRQRGDHRFCKRRGMRDYFAVPHRQEPVRVTATPVCLWHTGVFCTRTFLHRKVQGKEGSQRGERGKKPDILLPHAGINGAKNGEKTGKKSVLTFSQVRI